MAGRRNLIPPGEIDCASKPPTLSPRPPEVRKIKLSACSRRNGTITSGGVTFVLLFARSRSCRPFCVAPICPTRKLLSAYYVTKPQPDASFTKRWTRSSGCSAGAKGKLFRHLSPPISRSDSDQTFVLRAKLPLGFVRRAGQQHPSVIRKVSGAMVDDRAPANDRRLKRQSHSWQTIRRHRRTQSPEEAVIHCDLDMRIL